MLLAMHAVRRGAGAPASATGGRMMVSMVRWLQMLEVLLVLNVCHRSGAAGAVQKPHIVYFLVDDLGFSNVGYNNGPNPEPQTPHIDALHHSGAELTNYYVYRFCSPTRSSFMSGRLPYHVNQQNHPPASPGGGVPLGMTTLADKLNATGYLSHQIGKWHCGMSCTAHLPVNRGFSSSFGYLSGAEDHYDDTRSGYVDLWRSSSAAYGENGSLAGGYDYNTYKFTREAVSIVEAHPLDRPLFIYLAYQNVHGPIQAPSNYTALYDAEIYQPRLMCLAMIAAVDESIGKVTQALQTRGLWKNTLVIFSSDNGATQWSTSHAMPASNSRHPRGPADHANNWPLRGSKGSDFEGGTRVCAFLNGGFLASSLRGTTITGMMHIVDWWATLSILTGGDATDPKAAAAGPAWPGGPLLPAPDSLDMWPMLSGANTTSPRDTLVLRTIASTSGGKDEEGAIIKTLQLPHSSSYTRMKLVTGSQGGYWGGQYAPNQTAAQKLPPCGAGCLFNLDLDPTEHDDLATDPRYASTLAQLQSELTAATKTYFQSPGSESSDHAAVMYAKQHQGFWGPWLPGAFTPPPPAPPPKPLPPVPPKEGFILTRDAGRSGGASVVAAHCLTVLGLTQASHAVYGACDGGSHWIVDSELGSGGLRNVAAKKSANGYLRESPSQNCSVGNSAQLGVAGGHGGIVTVFDEAAGVLREVACGLCLGVTGGTTIELMQCTSPEALGWRKETAGHHADPFELHS